MIKARKVVNGENSHEVQYRFHNPYDLWERFEEIKGKSDQLEVQRANLVKMYKRHSYKIKRGGKVRSEPNWGVFKDAVDDHMKFFATIALDRKIWCRIDTHEGWEKGLDIGYSDEITKAFHKFCVNKWAKKEEVVMAAVKDDAFFNRGVMMWESPFDVYPCHVPMEDVFPDTNATTCPESFDLLFVRKEFTAVELYERANDPENAKLGWNKGPIMRALTQGLESLKGCSNTEIIDRWRRGGVSQSEKDQTIPLLFCYVKEYKPAPEGHVREGNRISLLVIPENMFHLGIKPDDGNRKSNGSQLLRRSDYFQFVDYYAKSFEEICSVWTSVIDRGFYDDDSFAKMIYLASKSHDQTKNTIIRAVKRAMRVWIKTNSADTKKRLLTMDADDETGYLNQDDDIQQVGIRQDVSAATEMLREARSSINSFSPMEFQGTQNSPKGYPITKGEANILSQQLDDSKSMAIKMAISKNRAFCVEMYRRFCSSEEGSDTYKAFTLFRKYLKSKDIPDSAWAPEEVTISPRFNKFGGNASSNYATAQGLVQATQLKPASVPEQRAKRDLIASLTGEANVDEYMEEPMQIDNEMFIIGQENEVLDNPFANPANIPVTPSDNHMLHLNGHIQDYMAKLQIVAQLLSQYQQDQSYRKQFYLERASDVVLAQDNKGAHVSAHFVVIQRDETKVNEVKQLADIFRQAQAQQDQLQAQIQSMQQKEMQENSRQNMFDLEYKHKERMLNLDVQGKEADLNLDAAKKVSQIEASKLAGDAKQEQKLRHTEEQQSLKQVDQENQVASKVANTELDLERKRIETQLAKEKSAAQAKKPNGKTAS
jgi:hypothetical protein